MKKVRTYIVLNEQADKRLNDLSERLSIPKTSLMSMAMQAGINAILRVVAPEEVLDPAQWAKILAEMVKTGQPVTLPDGTIIGSEGE